MPAVFSRWIGVPGACFLAASIFWYSGAKHSSPALLSGRPFGENSRLWHHLWFFKVFLKINVGLYSICHAVDFILSLCISMHQSTSLWCLGHFQNLRTKNKILNSSEIENFLRFAIFDFCGHQTFLHGQLGPPVDVFLPLESFDTDVRSTLLQLCSLGAASWKIQRYDIICGFSKFSWKSM